MTSKSIILCHVILITFMFFPIASVAQEERKPNLELEADPLAYILKGYSLHAGITYASFRSSIGVFAIQQPDFITNNEAFSVYTSGVDFKTDYLFKKPKGLHAGIQITYGNEKVELKNATEQKKLWGINLGARIGYRLMLGNPEKNNKGIYLNPWLAMIYSPNPKKYMVGSQTYNQSSLFPFPALHIGWRF